MPGQHATEAERTLFLVSDTTRPCGVEAFARHLASRWREIGREALICPVSGAPRDLVAIWRALGETDALVVNLPLVAWKKVLLTPLLALLLARLRGRKRILVLHEWADLDWRRRLALGLYALLADRLVFSSPFVRAGFAASAPLRRLAADALVTPIPSNIPPAEPRAPSAVAERIRAARARGRIVIGHFGSIYPKKQSNFVLEVAALLSEAGRPAFCLFIGDFVKGADRVEDEFRAKMRALGREEDCLVTGYVDAPGDLHALFAEVDCFLYRFPEGLTSRRGSVLACLDSGKPLIVNAPRAADEFDHHAAYRRALDERRLLLVDHEAGAGDYAARLTSGESPAPAPTARLYEENWRSAARAVAAALDDAPAGPVLERLRPR